MDVRVAGTIIAAIRDRIRAPTLTARRQLRLAILLPLPELTRKSKLLSNEKESR